MQGSGGVVPARERKGILTMTEPDLKLLEVAALAHLHPDTVRKAIANGRLPARRHTARGDYRITRADLDRWLEEGAPTSPQPQQTE